MSEAGCPAVADPGAALVARAHALDIPVRPLVGPSSILLALMGSALLLVVTIALLGHRWRIGLLRSRERDLERRVEQALADLKSLRGMLPICCACKRIRDDQNYWNQVETYLAEHTDVQFSHGICPSCFDRVMQDTSGDIR